MARSPRAVTARPAAILRAALTSALHRPALQDSHSKTAWLLRFPDATYPHSEQRCDVYAAGICSTRPKALCCKRAISWPQPLRHDCAVEPTFLGHSHARLFDGATRGPRHRPHVQRLDPDHVEPPRDVGGGFLDPVLTPIPLTGFQLRDRPFRPLTTAGATLGPGKPLLQHSQPLGLTAGQTRCVQQFAGGQRGRHGYAAVDADHAAVPGPEIGSGICANATCQRPARSRVTR